MAKKKTKKISKQNIFNITSIVIMIIILIIYGIRSMNYYALENKPIEQELNLVKNILSQNQIITEGTGLYQSKEEYYFVGQVPNNYVMFNNQIFRILSISNNEVKLISEENTSIFMYGNTSSYQTSNIRNYLTKTDISNSGIYLNTINNYEEILIKTKYEESTIKDSKISHSNEIQTDYITTLTLDDYIKAGANTSFINNNKYFHIIGLDENNNKLYIDELGTISTDLTDNSYGIKPVITLKENTDILAGIGTVDNPYIINQKDNTNYINNFFILGNDTYKVYEETSTHLRLVLNDGIKEDNQLLELSYSNTNSLFDPTDKNNLAYYLNTTYLNNLSYKNQLLDCTHYTGEISDSTNNLFQSIYTNHTISKIGLLNIFDYNAVPNLANYYYLNNISPSTDIALVNNNIGILEQTNVEEEKHIVPTICIDKTKIIKNTGDLENPHTME